MTLVAFTAKALPFYVLFYAALMGWWWLMTNLLKAGSLGEGILATYALPVAFGITAWAVSRISGGTGRLTHFFVLLALTIGFLVGAIRTGGIPPSDLAPYLGIGFISGVMTLMTFPLAWKELYSAYRSPLLLNGIIFMPLFIYFAAVLSSTLPAATQAVLFLIGMAGFWASAAWLASKRTQGRFVPGLGSPFRLRVKGLKLSPKLPFRPDLILPGGVNYVKGVVMSGVGLMVMLQPDMVFPPPIWNWWGFVLAFWGIITIIPVRGMYKMLKGRAKRLLGDPTGSGFRAGLSKDAILFVGLLALLYGFINAFMGVIPFTRLIPGQYVLPEADPNAAWYGFALAVASFVLLVLVRGAYKLRLLEGAETLRQLVAKQALLYGSTVLLIYGFVTMFMGRFLVPHPGNALGFWTGLALVVGGAVLILVFRPLALRNEFRGTLRIMTGVIAYLPEELRQDIMLRRIGALARLPEAQRRIHVQLMLEGMQALPEPARSNLLRTNIGALSQSSPEERAIIMREMDRAMAWVASAQGR